MAAEELGLASTASMEPILLPMIDAEVVAEAPHDHEPHQEEPEPEIRLGGLTTLKLALMQKAPFLSRYLEAAAPAACCGTCPTCIGTAVTGLALPFMKRKNRDSE